VSSLVLEVQRDAMDQKVRVSDLLRKALVVARKLRIAEFETWINHELRGYPEGHDYPAYRRMHGQLKAYNLHYGWQPVMFRNPDAARDLSSRLVSSTVAQLEASVNGGEAYGMIPVDDDVAFQISATWTVLPLASRFTCRLTKTFAFWTPSEIQFSTGP